MVRKSLNTHGTLLVYLLCRLLTVGCFQKNRFGEIVNSGSQNNSKVPPTLNGVGGGMVRLFPPLSVTPGSVRFYLVRLLLMRLVLERRFSRITPLSDTLIQMLSYHYLVFL